MQPKILITRPLAQAEDLANDIASHDIPVECIIAPLLTIHHHDFTLPAADALVFTSVHGVEAYKRNSDTRTHDVIAVGPQTAAAAAAAGFANIHTCAGTAADVKQFCAAMYAGKILVHIHGESHKSLVADGQGVTLVECAGYAADPAPALETRALELIKKNDIDAILFFSPRTAKIFKTLITGQNCTSQLSTIKALTLSEEVLEYVRVLQWHKTYTAKQPNRDGIINLMRDIYTA